MLYFKSLFFCLFIKYIYYIKLFIILVVFFCFIYVKFLKYEFIIEIIIYYINVENLLICLLMI